MSESISKERNKLQKKKKLLFEIYKSIDKSEDL